MSDLLYQQNQIMREQMMREAQRQQQASEALEAQRKARDAERKHQENVHHNGSKAA